MRHLLLSAVLLLTAGCISADYVGKTFPATRTVDVYHDKQDIKRPYQSMGEIMLEADDFLDNDRIQHRLEDEAMARGADAVLITGFTKIRAGEMATWQIPSSNGKAGTATPQYETEKRMTGMLLKYTQ